MVDLNKLEQCTNKADDFKSAKKTLRVGDWVGMYKWTCPQRR